MFLVPPLGGTYTVPPHIVWATLQHLRNYDKTEAVCFWLGRIDDPAIPIATVARVWYPRFQASAVAYDIEPVEMLKLKSHLDQSGCSLLSQVHSHPGAAFHSSRDDYNAASPWPGFISIVVPDGGRTVNDFWNEVEVYELIGAAQWKHLSEFEKTSRFKKEL